jgi:ATP-dependent helicase STH1/SNF2
LESAEAAESLDQEEQDDDDLNLIMMRSEDELKLFQEMDEQRNRNSKYGPNKKYPRLLGESELPEIYVSEDGPVVEEIEETYGRGARERTRVKYDDGLTEEQWLEAVDNDEDTIEEAIARKEAKVARRVAKQDKKVPGNSPMPSRESSESPVPKKRGRKPKVEKRKIDEVSVNGDLLPPRKRGRPTPSKETLTPEQRDILQTILDNVYDTVTDLKDEGGRDIIGPFIERPPKDDYPDYYQFIKDPICVNDIMKKINSKGYQNLRQFRHDVGLLCNNCRTYNEDGSILYQDANMIEVP